MTVLYESEDFCIIDNALLYKGDCLEIMKNIPDGSVDLILTDPPYGMSFQSNYREQKHKKILNDDSLHWLSAFINELYRVMKNNTAGYMFCSFHKIDIFKIEIEKRFKLKNILIWEKNNTSMGDLKGDFAPKIEFVFFFHKGRSLIRGKRDPNIFKFKRTQNEKHPTEKPVDLCEYLVTKFSDENQIVLDPFMGSGTTGVACKKCKRRFFGIEADRDHFNTSKERIASEVSI